jgi:hypothetical protein
VSADPTPERIAAALVLADSVDRLWRESPELPISGTAMDALAAYRATAPKLRTRAEVLDAVRAEVEHAEMRFARRDHGGIIHGHFYDAVKALCAETAADGDQQLNAVRPPTGCRSCGAQTFSPHLPGCALMQGR